MWAFGMGFEPRNLGENRVTVPLGTPARKRVFDYVKEICREHNLLPVVFDFEGPRNRNITETVQTLAYLSRFIIADVTSPKCIPQELEAIVPLVKVPVAPIIRNGKKPHAMFSDFLENQCVLPLQHYKNLNHLKTILFPPIAIIR